MEIRFIKGRLRFGNSENSAPFPSMLVIFKREPLMINAYDLIDYLAKPRLVACIDEILVDNE